MDSISIDQTYPAEYQRPKTDSNTDLPNHTLQLPILEESQLPLRAIDPGLHIVVTTLVNMINEPMRGLSKSRGLGY